MPQLLAWEEKIYIEEKEFWILICFKLALKEKVREREKTSKGCWRHSEDLMLHTYLSSYVSFFSLLLVVHMKKNIILTWLVKMEQILYFRGEMHYWFKKKKKKENLNPNILPNILYPTSAVKSLWPGNQKCRYLYMLPWLFTGFICMHSFNSIIQMYFTW